MVTQLKIIQAESGNVAAPKIRKNTKAVHKTEGRAATDRAQGGTVTTRTCQDWPGLHLSSTSFWS